jgi:hypothetical protein
MDGLNGLNLVVTITNHGTAVWVEDGSSSEWTHGRKGIVTISHLSREASWLAILFQFFCFCHIDMMHAGGGCCGGEAECGADGGVFLLVEAISCEIPLWASTKCQASLVVEAASW